jgi:hypothetical protein
MKSSRINCSLLKTNDQEIEFCRWVSLMLPTAQMHAAICFWSWQKENARHVFFTFIKLHVFGTHAGKTRYIFFLTLVHCVYVCQCYNCEMPSWVSCWNQFICIHHSKLTLDFWTVIVVGHPSSSFRLWQPPLFLHSLLCNFLQVIFLETICNDRSVIDTNIRLKIQQSPDYADM